MSDKPTKIYWDACIFIAWLTKDKRPEVLAAIDFWAKRIDAKQIILITSSVTRLEVLDCTLSPEQRRLFDKFLFRSNVVVQAPTNPIINIAHDIRDFYKQRKESGIELLDSTSPLDSIHLATAVYHKCDILQTIDEKNESGKGKRGLIPLSGNVADRFDLKISLPTPDLPLWENAESSPSPITAPQ